MPRHKLHEVAQKASSALVIGMGGGDFILGLPIINYLKSLGVKNFSLGSLCVQWWAKDGHIAIGPDVYQINCLQNAKFIQPTAAILNNETSLKTTLYYGRPPEIQIANLVNATPVEISLEGGVKGLSEGLNNLVDHLGIDLIVAVDCGGDSVVSENVNLPPLTPLHDWAMLAALDGLNIPSFLGLGGYACDGEVSLEELNKVVAILLKRGGLVGSYAISVDDVEILEKAFHLHFDPVDTLVLKAARGEFGQYRILGFRIVNVTPLAALILFFDPNVLCQVSPASRLHQTKNLNELEEKIISMGYMPETRYMHYQKLYRDR